MKTARSLLFLFLLFSAAAAVDAQCVPASTAAGALDTCFGTGGKVTTDVTNDRDFARGLAIQADGKIVVAGIAGYSATAGNADFLLLRYNTDGTLDTSFDGDGVVTTDFSAWTTNDDDYCRGLAIQPDGKIIVGGRSFTTPTTYALVAMRYNANGSLDTTFDGDGKAQFEMPAIIEMYAFALQPDGKILVGGRALNLSTNTFSGILVRFNPNGSLDTSFGTNGSTTAGISGVFSIALQTDGKIVASGTHGSDPAFAIARLNPNGSPDVMFGTGGVVTHHPTGNDQNWFVKIRSDNQIFIGGHSAPQGDSRGALLRFGSSGTLAQDVIHLDNVAFWNANFQPDAKLLTVGWSITPSCGYSIRRWTDVNALDTTFNGGGVCVKFLPDAVPESSGVNAVVLQRDNKIVTAGSVTEASNTTSGWRIAVARMYSGLPATRAPFDFDGDNKTDLSIFRPSVGEWWYLKSSDGGNAAAQFGNWQTDRITPADFTGDGKTDIAVWRRASGEWFVLRSEDFSYYSFPFGVETDLTAPADYDGDGKADPAVFRPFTGVWYILRSSDGGVTIQQWGQEFDVPVAADYDGDGKADIAVYRSSGGQWWLNRSTQGALFIGLGGGTPNRPVPGDYTGDGKADAAVFDRPEGKWYVVRSEDTSSFYSFHFGTNGDAPVAGDYDGDGKFDAAVFRPSNATWFVQKSTGGTLIQQFGLTGDYAVPLAYVP